MAQQIQQLKRRVHEQILERAQADPQWRRHYIEDADTAMSEIPEARQLQEMFESAKPADQQPAEATTAQEEYQQGLRSLMEKVLDKAASDSLWKEQLLNDPDAAIREANFPESQRLDEMFQSAGTSQEEVAGHGVPGGLQVPTSSGNIHPQSVHVSGTFYYCTCSYLPDNPGPNISVY